jgi:mono/diheme cytochrome c family protein
MSDSSPERSRRGLVSVLALIALAGLWRATPLAAPAQASSPPSALPTSIASASDARAVVARYCASCHSARVRTAGLVLDSLDTEQIASNAEIWEKVTRKLRVGAMPPVGVPRPDAAITNGLASWLEEALDRAAAEKLRPGRPALHRLNRAEYANAIRDLLDLEVDASTLLPLDDSSGGFDNNADALGVSPALLERYLAAARKISAIAVGDLGIGPTTDTYRVRGDMSQDEHREGLPLGTRGGLVVRHTFPLDGEYTIKVALLQTALGSLRGLEYDHTVEVLLDGRTIHTASVGGDADFSQAAVNATDVVNSVAERLVTRIHVPAGRHTLAATFVQRTAAETSGRMQQFLRTTVDTTDHTGVPHVESLTVAGPFDPTGPGDTPSRRRIFVCHPDNVDGIHAGGPKILPASDSGSSPNPKGSKVPRPSETRCATRIISTLARRAYRRPVEGPELARLMSVYQTGRAGSTFDRGIERALRAVLTSPKFVFRLEREPNGVTPGEAYRLDDIDLASRLSFFLWSSIPDEELLSAAIHGQLHQQATMDRQVRRLLTDPRSAALVDNFTGQWLQLRTLRSIIPDQNEFPDFDDNLRQAMQRETEMLFDSVVRENRSVLDLLTADYTFVNERLARHYGIPNVYGSHFRRVTLADDARKGLLGKGAILLVTSHPDRTSPVVRGKWILENLLGTPPPPPPANVPPLEDSKGTKPRTLREQVEAHRANPVCASCHKLIDPLGFALENFDGVGAWRTRDGGSPIDASGQLLDGTKVDGVVSLRQALLKRPDVFVGTLTEKLLTYALGRGLDYHDRPAVRAIVRKAAQDDYRFDALIGAIVTSVPFEMRASSLP